MSYIFSDCEDSDAEFDMMVDFVMKDMEENEEEYDDIFDEILKKRRDRNVSKLSHWERPWGVLLKQLEIDEDLTSQQHRLFRRRFRIPYPVFKDLVAICRERRIFEERSNSMIPVEIKVLVSLRILGRGSVADDIVEYTGLGETTVYHIFKTFIVNFTERCYESFVHFPTGDDLRESMEVYAKLGFPGCIGSIDGTRIPWERCPKADANYCTGKEGFPTVAFQCVVNHMRKIYHVSSYFYGSANDMTLAYYDSVTSALMRKHFYTISPEADQFLFVTKDHKGQKFHWKGVYMISDQGYQPQAVFMSPYIGTYELTHMMWSEWLESVRKDVECTFGILKSRFRFLKYAVRYKKPAIIEAAMKSAAILHNMLLSYDEIDQVEWENVSPDDAESEIENAHDYNQSNDAIELFYNNSELQDISSDVGTIVNVSDVDQVDLRTALIEHFTNQYFEKKLFWPRCFSSNQKKKFKLLDGVLSRTLGAEAMKFYVADSSLKSTSDPPLNIGKGLFSNISLACNQTILFFHGYLCSWEEVNAFGTQPNGYYTIELKKHSLYLDCYQHYRGGLCLASYANSPKNAVYKETNQTAKANAKLVIINQTAKLVATRIIKPNEEILWSYGRFKFPTASTTF